jgi:hypothetical protein
LNGRRDIVRVLDAWFVDGPAVMPDRLFDAVFDQVERVPQRRLARLRMRFAEMSPRIRLYSLAAAGLAVALVGIYLFNRAPVSTPGATNGPSAAPSATPTAPPTTGAVPLALREIWMGGPRPLPGIVAGAGVALTFSGSSEFWMSQAAASTSDRMISVAAAVDANRISLTTNSNVADCEIGDVGTYTWALNPSGRILTLTAESDACAVRQSSVPGTYWLMDCPTEGDNCLGPLDAGTYSSQFFDPFIGQSDVWRPRFDVLNYTVPDGWVNVDDFPDFFHLRPAGAPDTTIIEFVRDVVLANQGETCSELQDPSLGTTAADIAGFIADASGVVSTTPEPVSVGGLEGVRIDVELDPTWTETCPWSEGRPVRALLTDRPAAEGFAWALEPGWRNTLYLLDLGDGRAMMISVSAATADFDAFVLQATPVIESLVITR